MQGMIDISGEITFRTARSGGKGGQNVNKVETMVEGYFDITRSAKLTGEEKERLLTRLKNRINAEGVLQVRSQVHRSQLGNKAEVLRKIHDLIQIALRKEKKRVPTKPTTASKEHRIKSKKHIAEQKQHRQKFRFNET